MKMLIILLVFNPIDTPPDIQKFNTIEQCQAFKQLNHAWGIKTSGCIKINYDN